MIPRKMDLSDKFLSKTKRVDDCLEWQAYRDAAGYGGYCFEGKTCSAHRASWRIFRGEIPKGMHVLHRCDNRCCVNPDHLFLGTHKDNMDDMTQKGRRVRGELNGPAKLREAEVRTVRALSRAYKWSERKIAKQFGVSRSCINHILSGRKWKHI